MSIVLSIIGIILTIIVIVLAIYFMKKTHQENMDSRDVIASLINNPGSSCVGGKPAYKAMTLKKLQEILAWRAWDDRMRTVHNAEEYMSGLRSMPKTTLPLELQKEWGIEIDFNEPLPIENSAIIAGYWTGAYLFKGFAFVTEGKTMWLYDMKKYFPEECEDRKWAKISEKRLDEMYEYIRGKIESK